MYIGTVIKSQAQLNSDCNLKDSPMKLPIVNVKIKQQTTLPSYSSQIQASWELK